jgi:hypothetical protein
LMVDGGGWIMDEEIDWLVSPVSRHC